MKQEHEEAEEEEQALCCHLSDLSMLALRRRTVMSSGRDQATRGRLSIDLRS